MNKPEPTIVTISHYSRKFHAIKGYERSTSIVWGALLFPPK